MLALLESDEPDFSQAEGWGPDAAVLVEEFARSDDPYLASGAVYLAGLIPSDRSLAILAEAARHPEIETRIAAAEAMRQLAARGATPAPRNRCSTSCWMMKMRASGESLSAPRTRSARLTLQRRRSRGDEEAEHGKHGGRTSEVRPFLLPSENEPVAA
ncbi:MAG TPA: HEAT repeat domain-containing protein [Longimicrobium sp.]|nr:HEAT repeat domain-containing protein [Longimicrobium sp.]